MILIFHSKMAFRLLSRHNELVGLALCYCLLFSTQMKAKIPAICVFGYSLADVRNNDYLELSFLKTDFPHNGVDIPAEKPPADSAMARILLFSWSICFLSISQFSYFFQAQINKVSLAAKYVAYIGKSSWAHSITS